MTEKDEPKKPIIIKLRELPEDQKKLIFFVLMGVAIVVMGVFALWSTKNSMANLSGSVQEINMPK